MPYDPRVTTLPTRTLDSQGAGNERELPAFATHGVGAIALVTAALLVAFSGRYGYHRDELYFLACGQHLAWGYPDQPAFVPVVARLMSALAPGSLVVLRLPSVLSAGVLVVFTALNARELGGGRNAQVLAAASMAVSSVTLATGHLLSTATFDLPVWAAITWLVVRIIRRDNQRLWIVVGLIAGFGLNDNNLVAFLLVAIAVGMAIAGPRSAFEIPVALRRGSPGLGDVGSLPHLAGDPRLARDCRVPIDSGRKIRLVHAPMGADPGATRPCEPVPGARMDLRTGSAAA